MQNTNNNITGKNLANRQLVITKLNGVLKVQTGGDYGDSLSIVKLNTPKKEETKVVEPVVVKEVVEVEPVVNEPITVEIPFYHLLEQERLERLAREERLERLARETQQKRPVRRVKRKLTKTQQAVLFIINLLKK